MKTIKLGSSGTEVEVLQDILEIKQSGYFDMDTHDAVVQFQKQHGLTPDGIVGPITWNALYAESDTDLGGKAFAEYMLPQGKKDINGAWIPNYYPGPFTKKWLDLHHTAGWDSPKQTIDIWANDNSTIATEFVIGGQHPTLGDRGNDGVTFRCMPRGAWAAHLTIGNTARHRESIGAEICSMGGLTKGGYYKVKTWVAMDPNTFYTAYGTPVSTDQVCDLGWTYRFHRYFHKYSLKQIEEVNRIAMYVKEEHGINLKGGIQELVHKYGVEKAFEYCPEYASVTPGVYAHGHIFSGKNDIFPQKEMIDMIMSW
jgi:hypothetical protein